MTPTPTRTFYDNAVRSALSTPRSADQNKKGGKPMPLIVTPMRELSDDVERHYVRISNEQGDTIDLNVAAERHAELLSLALNEFAKSLTIIEVWDASPHP